MLKPVHERVTIREILELSEYPTFDEVKRNYKRLIKQYHPDVNKDGLPYTLKLNEAYRQAIEFYSKPRFDRSRHGGIIIKITYDDGISVYEEVVEI